MAMKYCRDVLATINLEAATAAPSSQVVFLIKGSSCSLGEKAVTSNMTSVDHQNQPRKEN